MLTTTTVSLVLLFVWGILYVILRKRLYTSKLYFCLLIIMGSAGLFLHPLPLMGLFPEEYRLSHILLFSLLMVIMVLPWMKVDQLIKRHPVLCVNNQRIGLIKTICILLSLLPLYSIIYALPYALYANSIGAADVRSELLESSIMPQSVFTTFAVGFASFSPVIVLLFYISLLDKRLNRYSLLLFISSMSILVTNMASAARDAFVFIPLMYLCFYFIFRHSLDERVTKRLRRVGLIALLLVVSVLGGITIDRFYSGEEDSSRLIYGTWGYFYQQPYVFDHILDQTHLFYGFNRRLKFLKGVFNIGGVEYSISTANQADYMFGTQFAEFYQMAGYKSLFIGSVLFLLVFYLILLHHFKRKNYFALLVSFCIYYLFTLSGMFYFRYGGNDSEFLFYSGILLLTYFIPNILHVDFASS